MPDWIWLNRIPAPVSSMKISIENIHRWAEEIKQLTDDEETFLDTLDGQTDFMDILERLARYRLEANAYEDAAKAMAETYTARAKRLAEKQTRLAQMIGDIMEAIGQDKIALPTATISRVKPRTKVQITDEAQIPTQLQRVKTSPDLPAIKKQLEQGEEVPGAELIQGQPSITVRVK